MKDLSIENRYNYRKGASVITVHSTIIAAGGFITVPWYTYTMPPASTVPLSIIDGDLHA